MFNVPQRILRHLNFMAFFYDTHAHLDYPDYAKDLTEVIARAQAAGITRIISIGTDLESSARAIKLAERFACVFADVGWHPSNAHEAPDDIREPLRKLVTHPRVVAIGETGLDYHHLPGGKTGGTADDDARYKRSEERRVGQECRSRWSP